MLKFFMYCLLLWHGVSIISAKNEFDDTIQKIPDIPSRDTNSPSSNKKNNERLTTNDENLNMRNVRNDHRAKLQIFNIAGQASSYNKIIISSSENCCFRTLSNNYIESNGRSTFKLHLRKLPWNRARRICVQEGGHLAVPEMDSEETEILKMMLEESVDDAWLGIHEQFEMGDWITVMGEPLDKTKWSGWSKLFSNNSNNYNGKKHCARLVRNGRVVEADVCKHQKSFVCKIPIF